MNPCNMTEEFAWVVVVCLFGLVFSFGSFMDVSFLNYNTTLAVHILRGGYVSFS